MLYNTKFTAHPPLQPWSSADVRQTHPSAPPWASSRPDSAIPVYLLLLQPQIPFLAAPPVAPHPGADFNGLMLFTASGRGSGTAPWRLPMPCRRVRCLLPATKRKWGVHCSRNCWVGRCKGWAHCCCLQSHTALELCCSASQSVAWYWLAQRCWKIKESSMWLCLLAELPVGGHTALKNSWGLAHYIRPGS